MVLEAQANRSNMEIFVVFKVYRQVDGEFFAIETESAFSKKEDAEAFMKSKPATTWTEKRDVPLTDGQTMSVDFVGMRGIHPTELK